jgi:TonB family protein
MTVAIAVHAIAIAIFAWITISTREIAAPPASDERADAPATAAATPGAANASTATFAFLDVDVAQVPRAPWPGPGDALGGDATPLPRARVDLPGDRAADRGGGAPGGPTAWSGRRDHDILLRGEPWNGGDAYRTAHDHPRAAPRTTEAIHRAPIADTGDRARAQAGAPGEDRASRGDASGQGGADAPRIASTADPIFDAPAGRTAPARTPGASRDQAHDAYADVGERANDVQAHGAPGDDRAVAASSDRMRVDPYDLTPASAGGADRGVRGASGSGASTEGGRAPGTASSRADARAGDGGLTVTAAPEDPFFRDFLRRLEGAVVFPRELAIDMRTGRVIASFHVGADGTIRDLRVEVPSAYPAFDHALVAALRHLGTLGPVPRRLLGEAAEIRVRVPFTFANPMIR